ncbi:MAG: hypothetical protein JRC99_01675, partial [Deltaproteobacteria bacterium]|nr:hypothetical protein [Deltaproteobacteria bacterium]
LIEELCAFTVALRTSAESHDKETAVPIDLDDVLAILSNWLSELSAERLPRKLLANAWHGTRTHAGLGAPILGWLLLHCLGKELGLSDGTHVLECLHRFGLDFAWQENAASVDQERNVFLTTLLMQTSALAPHPATCDVAFAELCNDPDNAGLLGINAHAGETWFSQEGMTALAGSVALQAEIMQLMSKSEVKKADKPAVAIADILRQRLARAAAVGYRLDKFLHLG